VKASKKNHPPSVAPSKLLLASKKQLLTSAKPSTIPYHKKKEVPSKKTSPQTAAPSSLHSANPPTHSPTIKQHMKSSQPTSQSNKCKHKPCK
jgi:hypothetical protein